MKGGMKMKRILVLVMALSLIIGITSVIANPSTNLTANVCSNIVSATVTDVVNFGNVIPGKTYTGNDIVITGDGSTAGVKISVDSITGTFFTNNLKLDGVAPIGKFWTFSCTSLNDQCSCVWDPASSSTTPTLEVPTDYTSTGAQTGSIVYLVTAI